MKEWIRKYGLVVLLPALPVALHAQEVTPVPVDTDVVAKTVMIAKEMIRVIREEPDCFNQFKGEFFLTDEYGNNYYKAKKVEFYTDKAYVDEKAGGQVSFVANWKQLERGNHAAMMAATAFTSYINRIPEGKDYVAEPPQREPGSPLVTYYLKEAGANGKRVASFIFNPTIKESTFIVDGRRN